MKIIVLLFFAFLGNCKGFGQTVRPVTPTDTSRDIPGPGQMSKKGDSAREKPTAVFFPNPSKNKVEIRVKGFAPGFIQVQFADSHGKTVKMEKRLLFSGDEMIVVMFFLPPGLYFVSFKQNEKLVKKKLVVE